MEEPRIHVGVVRRHRRPDGLVDDITVNLSAIPATGSDQLIDMMMARADYAMTAIIEGINERLAPKRNIQALIEPAPREVVACIDCGSTENIVAGTPDGPVCGDCMGARIAADTAPVAVVDALAEEIAAEVAIEANAATTEDAFADPKCGMCKVAAVDHAPTGLCSGCRAKALAVVNEQLAESVKPEKRKKAKAEPKVCCDTFPDCDCPPLEMPVASEPVPEPVAEIPGDEIETSRDVWGTRITIPPKEWIVENIGEDDGDNQLVAVNAGLTAIGYGGKLRHAAALHLIQQFGEYHGHELVEVTSIRDLSRADANIVLQWLRDPTPIGLARLSESLGQEVLL